MIVTGNGNAPCPFNPPLGPVDKFDREHQDWIIWWADMRGLTMSELDLVGDLLHEQPAEDLQATITGVMRRRVASQAHDRGPRTPGWRPQAPKRPF